MKQFSFNCRINRKVQWWILPTELFPLSSELAKLKLIELTGFHYFILATYHNYADVFVSLNGNDSESCGSVIQPCRSIVMAIRQVASGGRIYLDGTGTERTPYQCSLVMAYEQHPGTVVQKSLRMEGWRALPHISCFKGFHFITTSTTDRKSVV